MKFKTLISSIIIILLCCVAVFPVSAAESPVIWINIKGEIDAGQSALVQRAMDDAVRLNAQAVVLEIDTPGGLVDAALSIRDRVSDSPITTICYIKSRAWSAGALIALSHRNIAIAPGGSIGAAEPIPTTEKTVAALKAEFAATAHKMGRNPRVAEAMVDKSLGLEGYAEPGQILALTDYQAISTGIADVVVNDREALLKHFGLLGQPVKEYKQEWLEKFVGWLSDPVVKGALVTIIFLAIMTEIKTAGMGVGAFAAIAGAILLLGSQWLAGIAGLLEIILLTGGIFLLIVELYVPGTGIFGLAGVVAILGSIFLTLGANMQAFSTMLISMALAIGIFFILVRYLPESRLWNKLVLKDAATSQRGFVSTQDFSQYLGQTGFTVTKLRPAGMMEINGIRLDVVSEGQFIEADIPVIVTEINGSRIVVKPVKNNTK